MKGVSMFLMVYQFNANRGIFWLYLFLQRGWHFMECIIRTNLGTLMSKKTKYAMLVYLAQCWKQSRHMTCMFSRFLCLNECDFSVVSCFEERYIYSSLQLGSPKKLTILVLAGLNITSMELMLYSTMSFQKMKQLKWKEWIGTCQLKNWA